MDKRYSRNRIRKRKKNLDCFLSKPVENSVEEERQFKLRRFVEDVNKFVEEKDDSSNRNNMYKETAAIKKQTHLKKTKPTKHLGKKGLFQNGVQTKFCNRGLWGKEKTARLEENLQQIIGLSNKENKCHCTHVYQPPTLQTNAVCLTRHTGLSQAERKPLQSLFSGSRNSPNSTHWKGSPSPQSVRGEAITDKHKSPGNLDELDKKLYPEFTRIVTIASTESKSRHFKNKSYITEVKKKLLDIYLQGKNENTQESSCSVSDVQRSTVATSPLGNHSSPTEPDPVACSDFSPSCCSEPPFRDINFERSNYKSNLQFMEETIGPGSSRNNAHSSPALDEIHNQVLSPPLVRHSRVFGMDGPRERHAFGETLRYQFPRTSPILNFRSMFSGGSGDHHPSMRLNSFFPPIEEDSPEFCYFSRPMF